MFKISAIKCILLLGSFRPLAYKVAGFTLLTGNYGPEIIGGEDTHGVSQGAGAGAEFSRDSTIPAQSSDIYWGLEFLSPIKGRVSINRDPPWTDVKFFSGKVMLAVVNAFAVVFVVEISGIEDGPVLVLSGAGGIVSFVVSLGFDGIFILGMTCVHSLTGLGWSFSLVGRCCP